MRLSSARGSVGKLEQGVVLSILEDEPFDLAIGLN